MQLPKPLQKIKDGWMAVSHVMGLIMSKILLTVFWILVVGLYGIIVKISKRFQKKEEKKNSHWIDVENIEQNVRFQF